MYIPSNVTAEEFFKYYCTDEKSIRYLDELNENEKNKILELKEEIENIKEEIMFLNDENNDLKMEIKKSE